MLGWLAFFFGRTLAPGQVPLIEQVARLSEPQMTPALCRYTRLLTALWCAYFVLAALLSVAVAVAGLAGTTSALVWLGTAVLFAGERWLRPRFFPGHTFPGLAQQLRDTWRVWHPTGNARD